MVNINDLNSYFKNNVLVIIISFIFLGLNLEMIKWTRFTATKIKKKKQKLINFISILPLLEVILVGLLLFFYSF
jgi:Na+/proline symporter